MSHKRGDSGSMANLLAITRHDEYFLPGGDLFVMVDHVQFRVHKYFFERESPYFRRTLAIPASPGAQKPGTSESTALVLDDLKPCEFARFLWVFYNPKFSVYNASVDEWATILRLAHRWTFHEVKDLAVRELQKLDSPDIDRIVLYHECEVDRNLLLSQYAALCKREQPLELDEGKKLGLETTLMIASAREHARGCVLPSGGRSPIAASLALSEMVSLIRQLFRIDPPTEDMLQVMSIPVTPTTATATATTTRMMMTNGTATTTSTTNDTTASTTTNGSAAGSGSGSTTLNGSAPAPASNRSTTGSTTANGQGTSAAVNGQAAATANSSSNGNSNNGAKPGAGQPATPVAQRRAPAPPVSNANATPPPPDAPPKPPLKNDTDTNETGTNGAGESTTPLLSNGVERSGSNGADSDVESIEDGNKASGNKNRNKNKGNKNKNAMQNGTAAADRNTPSPINTVGLKDLVDLGPGDQNGGWSATPTKGKKGGWLNSSINKK